MAIKTSEEHFSVDLKNLKFDVYKPGKESRTTLIILLSFFLLLVIVIILGFYLLNVKLTLGTLLAGFVGVGGKKVVSAIKNWKAGRSP